MGMDFTHLEASSAEQIGVNFLFTYAGLGD